MADTRNPATRNRGASEHVHAAMLNGSENRIALTAKQGRYPAAVIAVKLIGSTTCTVGNITITASAPVLAMSGALVAAGHDPRTRLEAYRGTTLALVVRSIGDGARLEINSKGTAFVCRQKVRRASPMRKSGPA